ncbi:MAG: M28 family metallopeptidase [Promethearchaeota archaeon]
MDPVELLLVDMKNFILEFCEKVGPRSPCSNNESKAAKLFYNKLKALGYSVNIEKFTVHPGAYKASFRLPMILFISSVIFYWIYPLLSLMMIIISCLILIGEMYFVKEVIDIFFPKKDSQNVISRIESQNQANNLIIIGSHIDSNWEFPLIRKIRYGFVIIISINLLLNVILLIILPIKIIINFLELETNFYCIESVFYLIFIGSIPIALVQFFFMISNRPVMGANDNLSGMAVCYEIARYYSLPENRLKNTEIWINSYGCEEIGSKGSKYFVKKNYEAIKKAKVINLDMVGYKNSPVLIHKSEILGLVKMDYNLIEFVCKISKDLNIETKISSSMAYTDSISFTRKQISALSMSSMPQSSKELYYHTRNDIIENLDFKNLVNVYKICVDLIKAIDG